MALRNAEVILAACGGHHDYSGNEVTSIDLSANSPQWQLRRSATINSQRTPDSAYYADGQPSSRHTYWSHHWSPARNRLILHASRFVYGSAVSFGASNGFSLDSNAWDPSGTWRDGMHAACSDADGNVWALAGSSIHKWTASTDTWSRRGSFSAEAFMPMCHDSTRNQLFALAWGDGQGYGTQQVTAAIFTNDGTARTSITFKSSAALSQFQSDRPANCGMDYDPVNDQYFFYEGAAGRSSRVYVIKPNSGTVWDISILSAGSGSVALPTAEGSGIFSRFRYVSSLKGFVLLSSGTSNIYFMRTA